MHSPPPPLLNACVQEPQFVRREACNVHINNTTAAQLAIVAGTKLKKR